MGCAEKLNEKITEDVKDYVRLQVDSVKLSLVEHLSTFAGGAIGLVIFLFLANIALMFLAAALAYGLGLLIGSMVWAVVIVALICLLVGYLVFRKPTVFVNKMVRVFTKMFFSTRIGE